MTGARRRQGQFPAHVFCLLSTFALLAFALFPVVAGADSSGVQYSDAPPTATGKEPPSGTPAKSSQSHNGGVSNPSNTSKSQESHSSDDESSPGSTTSQSDTAPPGSGGAGPDGAGQQGSQGQGSKAQPYGGQQQSQAPAVESSSSNSDGGGSSPLVPVLIAIAVLAALSIGAVLLRRRRVGTVKTVSPKAS